MEIDTIESNKKKKNEGIKYTNEILKLALSEVSKGLPVGTVARKYNIPKSTLFYKFKGKLKPEICRPGRECMLGNEDEERLIQWVFHMSNHGFPVTKFQLLDSVRLLLKSVKKETPLISTRPGKHWFKAFQSRHSEVTERVSQHLSHGEAVVSEEKIRLWFSKISSYLEKKNLLDIDSSRVYNCDESAFFLSPKGVRVLYQKDKKSYYNFLSNDDKECMTALFCGNAAGQLLPPMVTFPYVRIPRNITKVMPKGWGISRSDSDWMTGDAFYEWVGNVFHPWLIANNIKFPVILFVDGHSSHITLQLSALCSEKNIELVALYPHSTHIIQPMDVALFHALKTTWAQTVQDWNLKNCRKRLKREEFGSVLSVAINKLDLAKILPNGFRATGLLPFSADGINFKKYFENSKTQIDVPAESSPSNSKLKERLTVIEEIIPEDILLLFKEICDADDYVGPLEHKSLFQVWHKVKLSATQGLVAEENTQYSERGIKNQSDLLAKKIKRELSDDNSADGNCSETAPN